MAPLTFSNVKLWTGGYDLTAYASECALEWSRDAIDKTAFGATARARMAGLQSVAFSHAGFYESGTTGQVETVLSANQGVSNRVITVTSSGGVVGDTAYTFRATQGELTPFGGSVGEANKYRLSAVGEDSPLVRGIIAESRTVTAAGTGTLRQLGTLSATQKLYVATHVTAISGTAAIEIDIRSDDHAGATSVTTRAFTTTPLAAVGDDWLTVSGPVTDDYWRVDWTITGTGSVTFVTTVGIV